jgi:hypothetical protein
MNAGVDDLTPRNLLHLPVLAPDRVRTERVRARCHAALAARRSEAARPLGRARFTAAVLEPALMGVLGLMYLAAVVHDVLRLRGMY